jgi:LacI family transcriptional regulator
MKHITQEDIARKLKVSRITVSKALRDHPDISAAMKTKVLQTSGEMGYSANQIAQQLNSRTTKTIGVIVPDLENSFFSHVVNSMIDAATEKGYQVLLAVSRENPDIEKKNIQNLIGKRVDGLLVCLSQQTTDTEIFESVRKMEIPLVFFDRALTDSRFSSVVFDDFKGVIQAIDQLVIAGFTRIAHLAGYSAASVGRKRLLGFQTAMEKHGLILWKEWIIEGGYEVNHGYDSFMQLHKRGNLPEIVLTVNDRVALGVYKACRELGLRIPQDIGVAGFGFPEITEMFSPPLSVISQDPRLMGKTAVERLIREIQSEFIMQAEELVLSGEFNWNSSLKFKR